MHDQTARPPTPHATLTRRGMLQTSSAQLLGAAGAMWLAGGSTEILNPVSLTAAEQPTDRQNTDPMKTDPMHTPPADLPTFPIIDTHEHLWDLTRFRLPWLDSSTDNPLGRSFTPVDYQAATHGLNLVKSVYMEVDVAIDQLPQEAQYVLDLCADPENPMKGAVIGGRPGTPEFEPYVRKFASNPALKGVRRVLHADVTPPGTCIAPAFVDSIKLLGDLGLRFDLCMRAGELMHGVQLVDQCPQTRFVLDHCGNLPVTNTDADLRKKWETGIKELAARPNVMCKISGIVASANTDWTAADLADIVNVVIDTFGEDRILFAADWPVCTLRSSFVQWVQALDSITQNRSPQLRSKLFHDNAVTFYGLA